MQGWALEEIFERTGLKFEHKHVQTNDTSFKLKFILA